MSASDFYEKISEKCPNIELFYIHESDVKDMEAVVPQKLKGVTGSNSSYEVRVQGPGKVCTLKYSCLCVGPCKCTFKNHTIV